MSPGAVVENVGRVLVVDDDRAMRKSIEAVLELEFKVDGASSVKEALMRLAAAEFDVVLTDYEMPGGNGLDLVRTVAQQHPDVMVILLTGHSEVVARSEDDAMIARVLAKPFDPKRLLSLVGNTVKLVRLRRATSRLTKRKNTPSP